MADDDMGARVGGSDMGNTARTDGPRTGGSEMGGAGGTATGGSTSGTGMEDRDEGMTGDDTGLIADEDEESGAGYGNHGQAGQGPLEDGMNSDQR